MNKNRGRVLRSSMQGDMKNIDLLSSKSLSRARATEILASADIMAELFRTRLSWLLPGDKSLIRCVPEVLRKRMSTSQVVSYRLVFSGTRQSSIFVLKRYSDKTKAGRTYSIMRMLWDKGFNRESNLKIPEPFAFVEDLGLLVVEKARGIELASYLKQREPVPPVRMRAVARWLTKLHNLGIDLRKIRPHPDEKAGIREFVRRAGKKKPHLLKELKNLASLFLSKLSAPGRFPAVPVHGDFQCSNIFVARDDVTVIDFDRFCRSDPARDVGYMIAQMRATAFRNGVPYKIVYPGLRAFWNEYLNVSPQAQTGTFPARAGLFAARKCLQNIDYILLYSTGEEDMKIINMLLHDARVFVMANGIEEALEITTVGAALTSG